MTYRMIDPFISNKHFLNWYHLFYERNHTINQTFSKRKSYIFVITSEFSLGFTTITGTLLGTVSKAANQIQMQISN